MHIAEELKQKVLKGGNISREEAILLTSAPLEELTCAADEIRQTFCQNGFDLCYMHLMYLLHPSKSRF